MASARRSIPAVIGIALIGAYSWIMMSSQGSAASWAWLVLGAAFAAVAIAARGIAGERKD